MVQLPSVSSLFEPRIDSDAGAGWRFGTGSQCNVGTRIELGGERMLTHDRVSSLVEQN